MPGGEVGIAYTASLTASGGPTPYMWSLDSGALPAGLTLGSDGGVSGVPTAPGSFAFTVRASDATNQYTTQGATITIAAHLAASLLPACQQACRVEQGCVNVCGAFGQQSGGVGPFHYSASGNIPGGMTLNGLSLAGSFPAVAQFWQFNVTVTDALGATASVAPTFYVWAHIRFPGGQMSCPFNGCSATFAYAGGTPGGAVSASIKIATYACSCQPPGPMPPPPFSVKATAGGGNVTITVTWIGSANTPPWFTSGWTGTLGVVLTDSSPCGPARCTTGQVIVPITVASG
ncbi:MAG TPA: Ig domain-containing protein [Candidatus Dormibacteraeota bacterium]|nr:Ig domain-containing protein [Candidatus Dormibacteraeota bacterium]